MLESNFQTNLKKKLRERFPGCVILKNDPSLYQGIPDLVILYKNKWAALECKKNKKATHQPNQDYYIDQMNSMSIARFIYPENEEEVLNDLQRSFEA